ncbi:MAG: ATP synthase F1 subunit delta [Candidatus Omnitrophica bacterium]|nr:ATP synthase F1 subunit delta [Candidatus Omnitrophota bacterium]
MIDREAARRYAEAFVNALEASSKVAPGLEGLKLASETYRSSRNFQRFLGSPEIAQEEKEKLLARLLEEPLGPEGMGLVRMLLKRDRIDHLSVIEEEAAASAQRRQGVVKGFVATAHPISSAQVQAIAAAVGRRLKKRVLLERQVDPKLLGGVRVTVGTTLIDGSVRTSLKEVRQQLIEAKVA